MKYNIWYVLWCTRARRIFVLGIPRGEALRTNAATYVPNCETPSNVPWVAQAIHDSVLTKKEALQHLDSAGSPVEMLKAPVRNSSTVASTIANQSLYGCHKESETKVRKRKYHQTFRQTPIYMTA